MTLCRSAIAANQSRAGAEPAERPEARGQPGEGEAEAERAVAGDAEASGKRDLETEQGCDAEAADRQHASATPTDCPPDSFGRECAQPPIAKGGFDHGSNRSARAAAGAPTSTNGATAYGRRKQVSIRAKEIGRAHV